MAETTPEKKEAPKVAGKAPPKTEVQSSTRDDDEPKPKASSNQPPLWARALLGSSGLALLVGFFLDWARTGEEASFENGMQMLDNADVAGAPSWIVLAVPILGAVLSAVSFMGLRYAPHAAIAVSATLIAVGLFVLGAMFIHNTALGLWIVAGGTFVTLLLGVTTVMLARRDGEGGSKK